MCPEGDTDVLKAGIVALAGAPNVGKSTLLNRLLGRKLSIESPKPQTTRTRVVAVDNHGPVQLVYTDTPGIHRPRGLVSDRMVACARDVVVGADVTCWLVAADRGLGPIDRRELASLADHGLIVALNKVDTVKRPKLLPIMGAVAELAPNAECVPVSARTGENVERLVELLCDAVPVGPWLYPDDVLTSHPMRFFAAEFVREQLFRQLDEELPYRVAVGIDAFEEGKRKDRIEAVIYTDTISARKIILGSGGARIKAVGTAARHTIEEMTGRPVYLQLNVRVKKNWHKDPRFLDELGL